MNVKKILSIIVVVSLFAAFMSNTIFAATSSNVVLEAENVTVKKGTNDVSVNIKINNNVGIATIGFNVGYDSSVMTLKSVECGNVFNSSEMTMGDLSSNPYMVSMLRTTGNTTLNGNIITLKFSLSSNCAKGTYPIRLSNNDILGGAFNINEEEVGMTLANGNVIVSDSQGNQDSSLIYGDVDNNKIITVRDGAYVVQKVLNMDFRLPIENVYSNYMKYADVDADGVLTSSDATMIIQKGMNNEFVFPVER